MKKVAVIMPALLPMPPVKGGAVETLVDGILKENEKHRDFAFDVYCIYDAEAKACSEKYRHTKFQMISVSRKRKKVEHFFFRVFKKFFKVEIGEDREYIHQALSRIKKEKWDAVVVENNAYFTYMAARKLKRIPILAHLHNDIINRHTLFAKGILRRDVRVIAVSNYIKKCVMTVKNANSSHVAVLPNCTNLNLFGRNKYEEFKNAFKASHCIGADEKIFMFAGRIIPEKGVLELARAFASVKNKKTRLLIVGSGWFSENVQDAYMQSVKSALEYVKDRILFTGYVPFAQMPKYYACCDIAVLPSMWEEPASLTVLESLASGLPLITTDAGGVLDTANEKCAFILKRDEKLVDNLVNCMNLLTGDNDLGARMAREAEKAVRHRDFAEYYKNFKNIVQNR